MRKPKSAIFFSFGAMTIHSLAEVEKGILFNKLLMETPPELRPSHFSFDESEVHELVLDNWLSRPGIPELWSESGGEVRLLYRGPIRGEVNIRTHRHPKTRFHSINFRIEWPEQAESEFVDDCIDLFDRCIQICSPFFAHMGVCVDFRDGGWYEDYERETIELNGVRVSPGGGLSASGCLPRFRAWINVLGPEYVELLGEQKLLGLDVFKKRLDEGGRIWLQMAELPEHMHLQETIDHVDRLIDSLDAPDVFCREPKTEEEKVFGIKSYRTPDFDFSEIRPEPDPPFSTRSSRGGRELGGIMLQNSIGVSRDVFGVPGFPELADYLIGAAISPAKSFKIIGAVMTPNRTFFPIEPRTPTRWNVEALSMQVVERLRSAAVDIDASVVGMIYDVETVKPPGYSDEIVAYKLHLESCDGSSCDLYIPILDPTEENHEYGELVAEPAERRVFV